MNNTLLVERVIKFLAVLSFTALAACGTTSKLQSVSGKNKSDTDLRAYETVLIKDFDFSEAKIDNDPEEMRHVGKSFAKHIYNNTRSTHAFTKVVRIGLNANAKTLARKYKGNVALVSGAITEFEDGSALARAMIGFGAGSSHFDADVNVSDAKTGANLGKIKVDKTSWVLGGAIAAAQDARSFIPPVAKKIAKSLAKSKQ
ncbi:DUF4410 domain-containing protein [Polycladidibacter hongkongensis]|uniref:DUF4410 domain-containing protein n=1 Tax=Polycladidibacter hongkongensis TaxID=1647556 RepID=UPI000834103E|nr:DUF4410 domain-containing protein [Pseudovibrio hongkongensis]